MVDVTAKPPTRRLAVARCAVVTTVDAVAALGDAGNGVGPVEAARVAGIQGAKLSFHDSNLSKVCRAEPPGNPGRFSPTSLDGALEFEQLRPGTDGVTDHVGAAPRLTFPWC